MYCPSCGKALSKQMKFCNSCGAKLIGVDSSKERLDEYLTGLFWITVFGLALILGGMTLMKHVDFSDGWIIGYVALSSVVFIINFALNLWEILRIVSGNTEAERTRLNTNELSPAETPAVLEAGPSVTENTTRELEPAPRRDIG